MILKNKIIIFRNQVFSGAKVQTNVLANNSGNKGRNKGGSKATLAWLKIVFYFYKYFG